MDIASDEWAFLKGSKHSSNLSVILRLPKCVPETEDIQRLFQSKQNASNKMSDKESELRKSWVEDVLSRTYFMLVPVKNFKLDGEMGKTESTIVEPVITPMKASTPLPSYRNRLNFSTGSWTPGMKDGALLEDTTFKITNDDSLSNLERAAGPSITRLPTTPDINMSLSSLKKPFIGGDSKFASKYQLETLPKTVESLVEESSLNSDSAESMKDRSSTLPKFHSYRVKQESFRETKEIITSADDDDIDALANLSGLGASSKGNRTTATPSFAASAIDKEEQKVAFEHDGDDDSETSSLRQTLDGSFASFREDPKMEKTFTLHTSRPSKMDVNLQAPPDNVISSRHESCDVSTCDDPIMRLLESIKTQITLKQEEYRRRYEKELKNLSQLHSQIQSM